MTNSFYLLHRLFRRLQQKNRFVGRVPYSGLTGAETHFLIELQADNSRSIADLASLLRLNQSSCSRIAKALENQKLLTVSPSREDSRKKVLCITKKGEALIDTIDSVSRVTLAGYGERVTANELKKLVRALEHIADGYEHPPGVQRPGEPEYRVQQRRVTRCFGLLGDNVFESDLSSSQWQALSEVVLSPVTPRTTELAELLNLAQNSLSSVIDTLEKRKLVARAKHPLDGRIILLEPEVEGTRLVRQIEEKAVADLRRGLREYRTAHIVELVDIVSRFVGEANPSLPPLLPGYEVKEVLTPAERGKARAFAVRQLVEQGLEETVPESLVGADSRNFWLSYQGIVEAVLEHKPTRHSHSVVFAAWSTRVSPWVLTGAINRIDFLLKNRGADVVNDRSMFRPLKNFLGVEE